MERGAGFTGCGATRWVAPVVRCAGVPPVRGGGTLCEPTTGGFGVVTRWLEPLDGGGVKDGPDVEERVTGGGLVLVVEGLGFRFVPVDGATSGAGAGVVLCAV